MPPGRRSPAWLRPRLLVPPGPLFKSEIATMPQRHSSSPVFPRNHPEEYVVAGDRVIVQGQPRKLIALLGTCVGVACYDQQAGVGGILHCLLPAPQSPVPDWQIFHFAETGLPVFIAQLIEAGARPDRLQAAVAGGALTGPVSQHDLALDIGGRTSDIVFRLLRENSIPIQGEDTGGYFGARLILDTSIWQANIEPVFGDAQHPPATETIAFPNADEIEFAIRRTRAIPQVALKIIRLIHAGDSCLDELALEVSQDQVLSAKILKFCNSSFFGWRDIASIHRALVLLGENNILEMALSLCLDTLFMQEAGGYALRRGGLFRHAVSVAHLAKTIAQKTGRAHPSIAYTAALLHDIGKIVLDTHLSGKAPHFYFEALRSGGSLLALEREILGVDHQEVGRQLAEYWDLPTDIVAAVGSHHAPEAVAPELRFLLHVVALANTLAPLVEPGGGLRNLDPVPLEKSLHPLGLGRHDIEPLLAEVPWNQLAHI